VRRMADYVQQYNDTQPVAQAAEAALAEALETPVVASKRGRTK